MHAVLGWIRTESAQNLCIFNGRLTDDAIFNDVIWSKKNELNSDIFSDLSLKIFKQNFMNQFFGLAKLREYSSIKWKKPFRYLFWFTSLREQNLIMATCCLNCSTKNRISHILTFDLVPLKHLGWINVTIF